jgi:23S rRNA pseudouridine1911/1915/1917 synthase
MNEENTILSIQAEDIDGGKRLDAFLSEKIENWSRSKLKKLIDDGDVTVNQKQSKASHKLSAGDEIEVELTEISTGAEFEPEDIPLDIVYEDEFLAVINKRSGMVVHPGAGVSSGTLANALAFKLKIKNEEIKITNDSTDDVPSDSSFPNAERFRVGIVHRLDKDTSGLIVVAKTEEAHEALSEQFRNREVYKSYVALVHGYVDENNGTINQPIAREKHNRTKMGVRAHGRNAISLWKVKKRFEKFTFLAVEIKTGRTHQIRVHMNYINHPIVGDETYNSGRDKTVADMNIRKAIADLGRFFLHAEKLAFTHPQTKERLHFTAALPKELTEFLDLL